MTMKKKLLTTLSVVLILGLAALGILAYLTDTDSDVNVMTLGNVKIEQHEYERVVENGAYKKDTINGAESYVLKDFTQGKPLMPATALDANGAPYNYGAGDYDSTRVKMSQVGSHGSMDVFVNKNAQDKFVTVENTGKSDAYVRTIIAYELGSVTNFRDVINTSCFMTAQDVWKVTNIGSVVIDGNNYFVVEYLYNGAAHDNLGGVHANGILPAGDTTYPSLAQVYMKATATNEDCEAIDGNNNGTYDILVFSQAVQAEGFADAETALNAAFGDITTNNHPWVDGVNIPVEVATADELADALAAGKSVYLTDDVVVEDAITIPADAKVKLNLNGNDITKTTSAHMSLITNNGDLTIEGNGKIAITFNGEVNDGIAVNAISNKGTLTINGATISNTFTGAGNQIGYAIDNYNGAKLIVNDGTITASGGFAYDGIRLFCGSNEILVTINGGEVSSIWAQNPSAGKATPVKGTVVINGGTVTKTYYENYTTVKVANGVTADVATYGAGTAAAPVTANGYTVYSFAN